MTNGAPQRKSRLITTWLALLLGSMGVHRLYLFGLSDRWAWLHVVPSLLGLHGLQRVQQYGLDDRLSWLLIPLLGLSFAAGMLAAIVYGLMAEERWNERFDPQGKALKSGWMTVIGVVFALALGAAALMATIAFSAQRFFEFQAETAPRANGTVRETRPG